MNMLEYFVEGLRNEVREAVRDELSTTLQKMATQAENRFMTQAEMCRHLRVDSRKFKTMNLPAYKVGKSIKYKLSDIQPVKVTL